MKNTKAGINKRRGQILKLLEFRSNMSVQDLSEYFKISEITIRRDLNILEENNLINRHRGGASLNKQNFTTNIFSSNLAFQKHAIAKLAANLVEDGDTIFINTSSTALLMLDYIEAKQVTVITNNVKAVFLNPKDTHFIILTGGELRMPKESLVGDFATNNLKIVTATKSFLGCSGISLEGGFTTAVLQEVAINQTMLKQTRGKKYILADYSKVGISHSFLTCEANCIDTLITDDNVNREAASKLIRNGVEVLIANVEKD